MKRKTNPLQLSLFDVLPIKQANPNTPFWWYGLVPKVGDLVHADFVRGKDLISGHDRCYTGGGYGIILSLKNDMATIHFPAHPEMKFIVDQWFEMYIYAPNFGPVNLYNFNETNYRASRQFKPVPMPGAGIEYYWCGEKFIY